VIKQENPPAESQDMLLAPSPEEKKVKPESPPAAEVIPKEEEVKLQPPPTILTRVKPAVAERQMQQLQDLRTKRNIILERRRTLMTEIWQVGHQLDLAKIELGAVEARKRNVLTEIERNAKNQWVMIEAVGMI